MGLWAKLLRLVDSQEPRWLDMKCMFIDSEQSWLKREADAMLLLIALDVLIGLELARCARCENAKSSPLTTCSATATSRLNVWGSADIAAKT